MTDDILKQLIDKIDSLGKELTDFRKENNKKLNTIAEQVVRNSEHLTSLSETQALLIAGQQKQDKILEALAMRSLEQETDIKELKRIK